MTASAILSPPTVTLKAHDGDGKSQPLMITTWVNNMQLKKTLLDGGSMVELISRALVKQMNPKPCIFKERSVRPRASIRR